MTDDEPNIAPKIMSVMLPLSLTGVLKSAPIERDHRFAGMNRPHFSDAVRRMQLAAHRLSNVEYRLSLADPLIGI
ncbi:hypothetical protein [Sphingomonas phyllosphaerae]|uniref:hypothetical protein n=1 Tax=Sphingomonas phyllosphaerae TaxID=257003 RepID=UPI0012DF6665|nr:hypothetical protein [Sphingomonas phyllosphaerae]